MRPKWKIEQLQNLLSKLAFTMLLIYLFRMGISRRWHALVLK